MVGIHQVVLRQRTRLVGHCLLSEWPQRLALTPQRVDGLQKRLASKHRFVKFVDGYAEVFLHQLTPHGRDLAANVFVLRALRVRFDGHIALAVEPHRPVVEIR